MGRSGTDGPVKKKKKKCGGGEFRSRRIGTEFNCYADISKIGVFDCKAAEDYCRRGKVSGLSPRIPSKVGLSGDILNGCVQG